MVSNKRDIYRMCDDLKLTVEEFKQAGSNHHKLVLRTPGGHKFMSVFAMSPSDHRYNLNQRAVLRRKIKELDGQ